MQMANGRFTGDFWGNFTHHNKNKAASTVDLAIISDNLFPLTDDLKVLAQTEFSDHFQIILTIGNLRIPHSNGNPHYQWLDRNKQYKWNKDPKSFVKALNSDKVKLSIIHCTQLLEAGLIESSGQMIQKIFRGAAKIALHPKSTKQRINKNKHTKKWFELDCIKLKNRARELANRKHKNPWDKHLQQMHRTLLKDLRRLCNFKRHQFWKTEISKLENPMSCHKCFWDVWKGLDENKNMSNFADDMDGYQ